MEVTDICMDKEPDSVVTYVSAVSHDSHHLSTGLQDVVVTCEHVDEEIQCYPREENAEVSECEVKECTTVKQVEISTLFQVEGSKDQDIPSSKCEIGASMEEQKSENQKVKDDCKRLRASVKSTVKPASGNCKTRCTVPQPFALATAKRASFGTRPLGSESDNGTGNKTFNTSTVPSSGTRQNQVAAFSNYVLHIFSLKIFFVILSSKTFLQHLLTGERKFVSDLPLLHNAVLHVLRFSIHIFFPFPSG